MGVHDLSKSVKICQLLTKVSCHVFYALQCIYTVCFRKKSSPHKTFWNIFTSVKSFCVKSCKFVGNSYPHISTNSCAFILIFHQMAFIFQRVPIIFTVSSCEYWMQTLRERGLSYTLTKSESWALLRKSAVESTARAQPFCVNQTVGLGDLPQRLHAQFVVIRQFFHC